VYNSPCSVTHFLFAFSRGCCFCSQRLRNECRQHRGKLPRTEEDGRDSEPPDFASRCIQRSPSIGTLFTHPSLGDMHSLNPVTIPSARPEWQGSRLMNERSTDPSRVLRDSGVKTPTTCCVPLCRCRVAFVNLNACHVSDLRLHGDASVCTRTHQEPRTTRCVILRIILVEGSLG
jgi:hypothetical protein